MAVRPSGLHVRLALAIALTIGATSVGGASHDARAAGLPLEGTTVVAALAILPADETGETAETTKLADAPDATPTAVLPRWRGGVNLYRKGVFSTQRTWYWCTAAGAQLMRNIVHRKDNHARQHQRRIFSYMRAHNRYAIPIADGVDPTGWAAGLRKWVDPRYRVVARGSFKGALRSAVTRLRKTNLPIAIAVGRGTHAWVLTGFTATADPAVTKRFKITSVRVSGPLWGRQNAAFGYDMRPDKKLTPAQLRRFFTHWHYPRIRMAWEGRWVSIQPVGS